MFKYHNAICRCIPESFNQCLTLEHPTDPINIPLAKQQHDKYVELLKSKLGLQVLELEPDKNLPDCCFVEDTCIVFGNIALITFPGALSRRAETEAITQTFQKKFPNITVRFMHEMDPQATLDGGDVLVTGKEILVGLSSRTNEKGVKCLSDCFASVRPTRSVEIPAEAKKHALHLKSFMSALSENVLIVHNQWGSHLPQDLLKSYETVVFVPDMIASNVLRIKDSLIIQQGFPKSEQIIRDAVQMYNENSKNVNQFGKINSIYELNMSELIKADGALTCCSLLF